MAVAPAALDEEAPGKARLYRRNRDHDQDDTAAGAGAPGTAAEDEGPVRSLGNADLHRGLAA